VSSGIGARSNPISRGPTTAESLLSIRELEMALEQALAERNNEFAAVEEELAHLSRIYERLRGDMRAIKEERDRALDAARDEREKRARETLELTERLEKAMKREDSSQPVDALVLRERFVAERLAAAPAQMRPLAEGELPDVPGFELIAKIGRGGMATVFQARRRADDTEVALKLMQDGTSSSRVRTELFLREAAVMLQLDHPGLVAAFDAGECAYGRYLAMEYVAGESLSARLRRDGVMAEAEAVKIAVQAARALAYCARLGLTHRDIKPSNVLITPQGTVKLCDFGLAALSSGSGDPARPYGSPGYASPEQLTTPTDVDERGDIYGLGCTLWQMVVGRRPFTGPAKQAFDQAKTTDLPDPRFEGADISPRLAQVIRRMGRAERERRYRRWDECLLDLMLVEKGNPPFSAHLADARESNSAGAASDPLPQLSAVAPPPVATPLPATETAGDSASAASAVAPSRETPPAPADDIPVAVPMPARRSWDRTVAFLAGAGLFGAIAFAVASITHDDPVAQMRTKAHELAASGRADDAARCLREAAEIAPPDVAADLRSEADAIEKK
jgi:serine/threonine protein kinase